MSKKYFVEMIICGQAIVTSLTKSLLKGGHKGKVYFTSVNVM